MSKISKDSKIYISGHNGMVGAALVRLFRKKGYENLILRSRAELDLLDKSSVEKMLAEEKPDFVIIAAAKVGGIYANDTYSAEFIYENLSIAVNTIHASYLAGVKRLIFLGSSCIYPRLAPQPMNENCLLTGELEKTNEAYAIAKIAGLKMCEYYQKQYGLTYHSAMPTNLYGKGDNYHPENSHVLPALIRRFHEAKEKNLSEVEVWGSGKVRREFLNVDDCADGIFHLLEIESPPSLVNLGVGEDLSIKDLSTLVKEIIGFKGNLVFDKSKPDGTPRKLLDVSLINSYGWKAKIPLKEGIESAYNDFLEGYRSRS